MKQQYFCFNAAVIIIAMSLAGSVNAHQAPDTVFGLEINAPPSIPECHIDKKWGYQRPSNGACYKREGGVEVTMFSHKFVYRDGPLGDEKLEIIFANGQEPASFSYIVVYTRSGKVAFLQAETGGISTQAHDLAQVTEKFGEPTRLRVKTVQNNMGVEYEGLIAEWELPSKTYVRLESPATGVGSRGVDKGYLVVQSATWREEVKARQQAEDAARTGL